MRSFIELLLAVVIVIIVVLLIGLFLPGGGHGHVERSIIIERPASHVFDVLNSYKRFNEWSPWAKKDPEASYSFSGPTDGQGALMTWSGSQEVGSGRWEILESTPTSTVKMIHSVSGGRTATVLYDIASTDNLGVKVTWNYNVELGNNPIERIKGRYLDSSIGGDYQYGLMRLKALIESSAFARDYSDIQISRQELRSGPALKLSGLVEVYSAMDFPDLNAGVADTLKTLQAFADRNRIQIIGAPRVVQTLKERYRIAFDVYVAVDNNEVPLRDEIEAVTLPTGPVLVAEHVGERRRSNMTFEKLQAYASVHGLPFDTGVKPIEEFLPDREVPRGALPTDAAAATSTDAAANGDAVVADAAASGGTAAADAAQSETVTQEVTRIYLPLSTPAANGG